MSETHAQDELKPCPFCGERLEVRRGFNAYGRHSKDSECIMAGRAINIPVDVERWNARAALQADPEYLSGQEAVAVKAVRDAQAVLAEYIIPDSGIGELECVNQLLGILDHKDLVVALRASPDLKAGKAEVRNEALREALETARERFDQIDCAGFTQNQQSVSDVLEYVKGLASDGSRRVRAALNPGAPK